MLAATTTLLTQRAHRHGLICTGSAPPRRQRHRTRSPLSQYARALASASNRRGMTHSSAQRSFRLVSRRAICACSDDRTRTRELVHHGHTHTHTAVRSGGLKFRTGRTSFQCSANQISDRLPTRSAYPVVTTVLWCMCVCLSVFFLLLSSFFR